MHHSEIKPFHGSYLQGNKNSPGRGKKSSPHRYLTLLFAIVFLGLIIFMTIH